MSYEKTIEILRADMISHWTRRMDQIRELKEWIADENREKNSRGRAKS